MTHDDHHQPFTLWFETLASEDTAGLLVCRASDQVTAVLYFNEHFHSERRFETPDAAAAWGYELRRVLLQDALAGALLGYDGDVLTQMTDAVTA